MKKFLGRVLRDVERKLPEPSADFQQLLSKAKRIYTQKRDDNNKLYSVYAPEVECIAKGKAHKKYEFGCKVSVSTIAHSNLIVATDVHRELLERQ